MGFMDIIVGFGSLVIIPFLGILNLLKVRAFPYLAAFLALWLFLGLLIIGGGVTPIDRYDFVTPEERAAWFALPAINFVQRLWLVGLALGVPLLIITGFYEHFKRVSNLLKLIKAIATITTFIGSVFSFIKFVIIPRFFG